MFKHIPDVPEAWYSKIKPFLSTSCLQEIDQHLSFVSGRIYPLKKDIFCAFELTAFEDVKVIFLGQDPYHGANQACGLSFAVSEDTKAPPSLKNIIKELKQDLNQQLLSTDLKHWAKQGVFLLNRTLTVEENKPLSHKSFGWDCFIEATLKALLSEHERLVFVALGKESEVFLKHFERVFKPTHKMIIASHPSPLSAHRGFLGSKLFTQINQALIDMGFQPIQFGTSL